MQLHTLSTESLSWYFQFYQHPIPQCTKSIDLHDLHWREWEIVNICVYGKQNEMRWRKPSEIKFQRNGMRISLRSEKMLFLLILGKYILKNTTAWNANESHMIRVKWRRRWRRRRCWWSRDDLYIHLGKQMIEGICAFPPLFPKNTLSYLSAIYWFNFVGTMRRRQKRRHHNNSGNGHSSN